LQKQFLEELNIQYYILSVPKSMLGYIEVPKFSSPTMMALAAMGTHCTHTQHPETFQAIPNSIEVTEIVTQFHSNTLLHNNHTQYICYRGKRHGKPNAQQQFMQKPPAREDEVALN